MEHATCWKDYDHCEDIFMKGKWKVFVVGMKSGWGGDSTTFIRAVQQSTSGLVQARFVTPFDHRTTENSCNNETVQCKRHGTREEDGDGQRAWILF